MAKPKGWFQYDRGKWAFYNNKTGGVDWDANAPKKGGQIFDANRMMKRLNSRGITPPSGQHGHKKDWQKDQKYKYQMGMLANDKSNAHGEIKEQMDFNTGMFGKAKPAEIERYGEAASSMHGRLAGRGLGRSGMRTANADNLAKEHENNMYNLRQQYGDLAQGRLTAQRNRYDRGWDIERKELDRNARNIYLDKVESGEIKQMDKGFYKRNGIWHFRNADGVEISLGRNASKRTPGLQKWLNQNKKGKK